MTNASLLDAVKEWSTAAPERIAHQSGERRLSYRLLQQQSDGLAAFLSGALPDDRSPVAVIGHKAPEMLVGFLGAVKAGRPYIPIDTSLPERRVQAILDTAQAGCCLTPEKIRQVVSEPAWEFAQPVTRRIQPDDPWYIIFTSGSTGEPKGVVITAGCLESFVQWMLAEQAFHPQAEIFLNQAPFSFDLSVMDMYLSLATGGTLVSISQDEVADPPRLFQMLAAARITVWVSTPSFAQLCLAEPTFSGSQYPALRKFLFCGETLAPEAAAALLERFPGAEVWNTYGPTEACCATTSLLIDRSILGRYSPLPVGYPKPGSRILVLKRDGAPAAEGAKGEIIIAGANVSPGYLARPDLNAAVFFQLEGQRAYRTGDHGHYQDGLLFFDGRMDDQVKLHGYRIELGDVETNLRALPAVLDAVALPVMRSGRPDHLAAFVILKEAPQGSDFAVGRALKRALGQLLPAYMLPRKFIFLRQFPLTANGKADRRKLAESLA